jgi:hypothetical protein
MKAMHTTTIAVKPPFPRWSLALGVVLVMEAFVSPIVWWGAFIFGSLFSTDTDRGASTGPFWLEAVDRLGNWGVLLLFALLVGAAVLVFARPSRYRPLVAAVCIAAGLLNALVAIGLLRFNAVVSDGPIGARFAGVVSAAVFGLVAVGLVVMARQLPGSQTVPTSALPPPPM